MDNSHKSPYDVLIWPIVGCVIIVGIGFAYSHFRTEINTVIMKANDVLLSVITMIPGTDEAYRVREGLRQRHPGTFQWNHMLSQIRYVATYTRWPVVAIVAWLALLSWRRGVAYQRILSMRELVRNNVEAFPYMAPVAWREIDQEPLDEGPWRVSRQPLQFALENNLLLEVREKKKRNGEIQTVKSPVVKKDVLNRWGLPHLKSPYLKGRKKMSFDHQKAAQLMEGHLGPVFKGIETLPDYQKGLLAAFIAFGAGNKSDANDLINQMALSFVEPGRHRKDPAKPDPKQQLEIDINGADDIIEKYLNDPKYELIKEEFDEYTEKHKAFTYPYLAAAYEFAGRKGILEGSKFIWLVPTNRTLWYVLNQQGRRTPWPEAAGAFTHYEAEESLAEIVDVQGIEEPEVKAAVDGLHSELAKEGWFGK